jgi:molybdate transport system substrate-binding protein
MRGAVLTGILLTMFALMAGHAGAAEIRVLTANVFTDVLDEHFREYERASGDKVVFEYVTAGKVRERIQSGEQADVAILTRPLLDQLEANGKIVRGSATDLARSAVALVIRRGASKPDISSTDAFKRTLLSAHSLSYANPARGGATGILVTRDLERLNLVEDMKSKTVFPKPGQFAVELVAHGDVEMAIAQPMEARLQSGVEIVGRLPAELQDPPSFTFSAGEVANAGNRDGAHQLIAYLASARVQVALQAKGMDAAR